MRNRKKQEAIIFLDKTSRATRKAKSAAEDAKRLLGLDMTKPDTHRIGLKLAAKRAEAAANAAYEASTSINPERYENTELWDDILEAHRRAQDAAFDATRAAEAVKSWLQ